MGSGVEMAVIAEKKLTPLVPYRLKTFGKDCHAKKKKFGATYCTKAYFGN